MQPRTYAAGDRILVHANLAPRSERGIHNGATGTVVAVSSRGAEILFDDTRHVFLPAEFISGCRPDGTPNLSHAWARTVDGAQGGTWQHVHLLGTPALDHYTGYVGQSRGRQPTHTWNTRPEPDHPTRLLADQRTPSQVVADALRRAEPKTFAATDDPWTLDRHLRDERAHHAAIIVGRPPDARRELDDARQRLARSEDEYESARAGLACRQAERERLGPLTRLRRGGRDDIARAEEAVGCAERRLAHASNELEQAARRTRPLRTAQSTTAHDGTASMRGVSTASHELDDTLAHHWANIVLRAVRADDPLAFGVQRLRDARATYHRDHQRILDSLPPDRRRALTRAQADTQRCQQHVRDAEQRAPQCTVSRRTGPAASLETTRHHRGRARKHGATRRRGNARIRARRRDRERTAAHRSSNAASRHTTRRWPRPPHNAAGSLLRSMISTPHSNSPVPSASQQPPPTPAATCGEYSAHRLPPAVALPPGAASPNTSKPNNDRDATAITLGREVGSPALRARIQELLQPRRSAQLLDDAQTIIEWASRHDPSASRQTSR